MFTGSLLIEGTGFLKGKEGRGLFPRLGTDLFYSASGDRPLLFCRLGTDLFYSASGIDLFILPRLGTDLFYSASGDRPL
ncbi:MAG: hypothetical protein LBQ77_01360 [Treponema sp.]|nr:hypothetical protein [Treponema sp.]